MKRPQRASRLRPFLRHALKGMTYRLACQAVLLQPTLA